MGLLDAPESSFSKGKQPCSNFKGKDENFPLWHGNRHECFGPWNNLRLKGTCSGQVSLCKNCSSDHHQNGYETCPVPKPPDEE